MIVSMFSNNISISDGVISLSPNIDVNNVHILGVDENSTISIGDKFYLFLDTDNDLSNGYELVEFYKSIVNNSLKHICIF